MSADSYQTFDPSQPCSSLLPLNPVETRLSFYKVCIFDIPLSDVADLADLPVGYAGLGAGYSGPQAGLRLGLPVSTLFPRLRTAYQEVRIAAARRLPVRFSLEGSLLPFDPKRPGPDPLAEHAVAAADVAKGRVTLAGKRVTLDDRARRLLSATGSAVVKAGGKSVLLTLAPQAAGKPAARTSARSVVTTMASRSGNVSPADLVGTTPGELSDPLYEDAMLALLGDARSGTKGTPAASTTMARTVAGLPDRFYFGVFNAFRKDPRLTDLLLRIGKGVPGLVHARPKLPRYDIGLFSAFEQTWTLQGYSRGALVKSITLAPQEEMSIEVFTFDRTRVEEERTLSSEFESSSELSAMTSITGTIARSLSENTQISGDIGLGLPLPAGSVPISIEAGVSSSMEVKADIQASMERVSEVTTRVAEKIKSTRQVKIVESRESGREDRVTRKIRNPNQGHALTLNCYEVLETFKVDLKLKDAKQFCLLVEQPDLGPVDVPFVLAYQDRLQKALLSNVYASGFEAARNLYAQGWFDTASIQKAEIEAAANQSIAATAPPSPVPPIVTVAHQLAAALSKIFDADLLEAAETLAEYYNPFDGKDVSEREKAAAESALGLFNYAVKLKIVSPGIEDRARSFMADMRGNPSESAVVEALGTFLSGTDDEWVTNLKMVAASLVSAQLASLLLIPFPVLVPVFVSLAMIENNAGYPGIVGKAKQQLKAHEMAASVVPPNGDASTAADIKTKEPPPQLFSLQDLARTRADFDALRLHVEANRTYYMNQIWKAEDPNARFERFRQLGIDGYVENRLLGFVGDRAIYVLRLSALDPETRRALLAKLTDFDPAAAETVGSGNSAVTVGPVALGEQVISLPTPAIYMDGGLGRCELLEPYLVERREIEKRIATAEADLAEIRVAEARRLAAASAPAPQPVGN